MQFFPKEPTIQGLCQRIERGTIDLQPDFQRGEVWSIAKKQRLIDTILRGWIVPPILLVRGPEVAQVLDGQQRLAAIRDFKDDRFAVDGRIEPISLLISSLNGLRFSKLPKTVADSFDDTALRVYEIVDYSPDEPAEIFFRLNQPTMLTSAEKRNAFFGPVRNEIRLVVEDLKEMPDFISAIGFSNSRMAFDDVLARAAYLLESKSLRKKATESAINAMYRRKEPLNQTVSIWLRDAVQETAAAMVESYRSRDPKIRLKHNKATLLSWILFFSRISSKGDIKSLHAFLDHFEAVRQGSFTDTTLDERFGLSESPIAILLLLFTDRATSRVGDVSSILLRDFVLWYSWHEFSGSGAATCTDSSYELIHRFREHLASATSPVTVESVESATLEFIEKIRWGEDL